MKDKVVRCIVMLGMVCSFVPLYAQQQNEYQETIAHEQNDDLYLLDIKYNICQFFSELNAISEKLGKKNERILPAIEKEVKSLDIRWNLFYQTHLNVVTDDSIPQMVAEYELCKIALHDTILLIKRNQALLANFKIAEAYISAQDSQYQALYTQAVELSMTKLLAARLEIHKGNEQLLFADISKNYAIAKEAADEIASLKKRMSKVEERYVNIKILSEKIQATQYKPFFQRVKDYLLGIAAVAIILMFLNMVQAKIKALKQARDNAKKYKNLFNTNDDEIPSI